MEYKFSEHDTDSFLRDKWISCIIGDYSFYFAIDNSGDIDYLEVVNKGNNGRTNQGYWLDKKELEKLLAKRPSDPSWHHNDPLCPNCRTYMIYKFEHCPKCGQKIDWSE